MTWDDISNHEYAAGNLLGVALKPGGLTLGIWNQSFWWPSQCSNFVACLRMECKESLLRVNRPYAVTQSCRTAHAILIPHQPRVRFCTTDLPADADPIDRIDRAWMLPMCLLLPRRSGDSALVPVQHRPRKPCNFTQQSWTVISYWIGILRRCKCDEIWSNMNSNDSWWFLRGLFRPKRKNLNSKQLRLSETYWHVCWIYIYLSLSLCVCVYAHTSSISISSFVTYIKALSKPPRKPTLNLARLLQKARLGWCGWQWQQDTPKDNCIQWWKLTQIVGQSSNRSQ